MRYTRYEYKKHRKFKFLCVISIIVGVSIVIGLYFSKIVFKGDVNINSSNECIVTNSNENFMALQFGYYANKENADAAVNTIPSKYNSYIIENENKYRVVIGLYSEDDGTKKLEELTSQGINVVKINFKFPNDTIEQKKISKITEGFLIISDKLEEPDVKSVKTSDYKTWCLKIIGSEQSSNDELNNVKEYVDNLPDEIDKTNVKVHLKYFYEIIEKYKV
ncbi:SPOR domain-containing protein [Clostridium weizhouense]|uniref:SPOR domain-containing protein n=1 Tax=Clostridium weizhouense TaxID=2859781 RepID=A0ABS7AK75_9CLOT|nr:SPOR domain-containing protein [Clostridium weizhouense]MBW6408836.1 SPOR domain-containing protein [Clostridium weizhouense]